jgi:hypothetical protein
VLDLTIGPTLLVARVLALYVWECKEAHSRTMGGAAADMTTEE